MSLVDSLSELLHGTVVEHVRASTDEIRRDSKYIVRKSVSHKLYDQQQNCVISCRLCSP